jgi:Na+/H+ antiporter
VKVFEIIISILLIGTALSAISRRIGQPYPSFLALAGVALTFIPGMEQITLDPELALALFIAPVLLDAAYDASPKDLHKHWISITSLVFGAVICTVIAVAIVMKFLVPALPWPAAFAVGAIVSPPDASAASAVLSQLKLPRRLLVILEGESLFNDASALIIYRLAVVSTVNGFISGWKIAQTLLLISVGSTIFALVLSKIIVWITFQIKEASTAIIFQFCSTFTIWLLAERLHLSGIITIVVFAMVTSRKTRHLLNPRIKIPTWIVWEVAVFILNILAFLLIGLHLKSISERISDIQRSNYLFISCAVFLTVVVIRFLWSFSAVSLIKLFVHDNKDVTYKTGTVVGWCGMRGILTLATAIALPINFPERDLIIACAFGVTIGTLILQGLTLKPLLLKLKLKNDDKLEDEIDIARKSSIKAAIESINVFPKTESTEFIRKSFQLQLVDNNPIARDESSPLDANVIRTALQAQRRHLLELKSKDIIGDLAVQYLEEELDWMELGWAHLFQKDRL